MISVKRLIADRRFVVTNRRSANTVRSETFLVPEFRVTVIESPKFGKPRSVGSPGYEVLCERDSPKMRWFRATTEIEMSKWSRMDFPDRQFQDSQSPKQGRRTA